MVTKTFLREVRLLRGEVPSFDAYPFSLACVKHLDTLAIHPRVTFLIGENGSGKSTLLEAIATAWGFNPEGGSRNFRFETRASHSPLHKYLRLSRTVAKARDGYFFRAESFFNLATEIERLDEGGGGRHVIDSYGGRSLHEQSHGESFLALMLERFGGHGCYLLDEPEAALSPQRQLAALARLHDLAQDSSQFIIATHSPILLAYPDAWIYQFTAAGIEKIDYFDTDHYRIARDFLAHPQRMLDVLMDASQAPSARLAAVKDVGAKGTE